MNRIALSRAEVVVLAFFALVPTVLGLLVTYAVTRLAVRDAQREAVRAGDLGTGRPDRS